MKNLAVCILLNVVLFAASLSMALAYTVDRPLVMFAEGRPEVVSQGGCSPSNPSACNPFSTCKTWYGPSGGPINSFQYYPDGTAVALPALQTEVPTATGWGTAYYQQWPSTQQDSVLSGLQWEGYSAGNIFSNVPFTLGRFTHRNFPITVYDLNGTLITKPCNKIQMDIIFQLTDSSSSTPFVTTKQISIDLQVDETPNTGCDPAYQAVLPNPYTNPWAGFGRGSCPFGCPSAVCDGTTCAREQVVSPTDYPCSDPLNGFNVPYGVDCGSGCYDRISILNSGATSSSVFTNPNNNQNYYLAILGFAVKVGDDPINTFITAEYESNSAYLYANVVQTCNVAGDCNDGVSCTIPSCSPPSGNYPAKYCTYALDDTKCKTLGDGCADGVCTKTGCSFTGYNNRCNAMGPCISSSTCTQSQADPSNWTCVYGAPDNTKCNYLKTSIPGCIPICNTTGYCGCLPTTTTTTTTRTTTPTTTTTTPTTTTKTTTTKTTTTTTTTTLCWRSLNQSPTLSSFGFSQGVSIPPATTLYVGYTVALATPGSDTDVAIFNSFVRYNTILCPGVSGSRTLTVGIPDRTLTLPGDGSFAPSNNVSDPATYQGVWYTADVCNGLNFNMSGTAQMTFFLQAYLPANVPNVTLKIKFHFTTQPYDAGCCGSGTPFSTVYSLAINTCSIKPTTTTTKASTTSTPTTTSTTRTTTTSTTTTSTSTPTTTSTTRPTTTSTTRPTTTSTTRPTTTTTTTTTTTQCPTACKLCLADLSLFLKQEPSCDNSCGDPYGSKTICVYDSNNADWYPVSVSNDQIYTYFLTADQQQWNFFAQTSQNHDDPSGKPARFDCDCNQIPPSTTTTTPPPPPQIVPKLSCVFCNVAQCWATIGYDATGQTSDVDGGFVVTRTVKPNINNYMTIKVGTGATVLAGVNGNLGQPTSFSTLGSVSSAAIITFSRFATITWYLDAIPLVIKQGAALPCINCDFPGLVTADAINTPDTVGVSYKLDFTSLLIFCGGSSSSRTTYLNTPRYFVADIPTCAQMFLPTVSPAGCTPQYAPIATWVPYPTWDPTVVNPSCFWNSMDSPYVVPLLPKTPSGADCSKVTITIQMPKASCPQVTLDVDDVGGLFDSTCLNCQECRTIGILGITSKCPVPQYCTPLSDGTPTSWNSATCQCEPCLLSCPPNWTPSAITCKCVPCDPNLCTPGLNYNTPTTCGQCTPCPANPEDQCAWNERVYKTLNPPVYFSNAITGCPECGPCDSCPSGQTYLGDDCTCGPCQNCLPGCSCNCPTCPIGYELDLENINPPSHCPCIACNVTCPPGSWLKDKDNQCLGCISCPLLDCGFGQTLTEDLCHCEQCSTEPCATGFRTDPETGCGCVECQELCSVGTILSDDKCSCIPVNITEPPTTPPVCAGGTIDVCGVCNGDGKACLGCDGQPGSPRWYDPCRVACGNGSTCNYCKNDECNVCTLEVDICGVCGGNGSSCLGCDGLPPTLTRPPTQYDWCGVCGGNGTSCLGCDGRPFSGPCPSGITPGAAAAVASLSALAALSAIAVALLLARLRKRPELLYQAWDDTLRDYITEIESNPLYNADEQEHNPLWARGN